MSIIFYVHAPKIKEVLFSLLYPIIQLLHLTDKTFLSYPIFSNCETGLDTSLLAPRPGSRPILIKVLSYLSSLSYKLPIYSKHPHILFKIKDNYMKL